MRAVYRSADRQWHAVRQVDRRGDSVTLCGKQSSGIPAERPIDCPRCVELTTPERAK